jgi:hypothetical protein
MQDSGESVEAAVYRRRMDARGKLLKLSQLAFLSQNSRRTHQRSIDRDQRTRHRCRRYQSSAEKNAKLKFDGGILMKRRTTFAFAAFSLLAVATAAFATDVKQSTFALTPQAKVVNCLGVTGGPAPTATVTVKRGPLHDTLTLTASNLKPKLEFDLFTIQNTNLLSNGQVDPSFVNFGLAWYQSDMKANSKGIAKVTIQTILLDQIFGFDPAASLGPTHTFHVGFWFNNPADAAACGFDVSKPTPFNGVHNAGPNAMISLPDATTDLGPLCTDDSECTP